MSLIIRVQTSQGTHRLTFNSKNATFGELQSAIESKYGISSDAQMISRTRPNTPDFIENISSNTKLCDIGLKHGIMIYLILADNQVDAYKQTAQNQKPQSIKSSESKDNNEQKYQSKNTKKSYTLKPVAKRKAQTTKKLTDLKPEPEVDAGPKHVPFHEFIEARQQKFAKTQPWNIDPPTYNYAPVPMGNTVIFSDLPPNAVVIRQKYRHMDVATFYDSSPFTKFKTQWEKNSSVQRCAYLIGKYELVENNLEKKKKSSIINKN
eukprot:835811_1